jgi:hypothetical protein
MTSAAASGAIVLLGIDATRYRALPSPDNLRMAPQLAAAIIRGIHGARPLQFADYPALRRNIDRPTRTPPPLVDSIVRVGGSLALHPQPDFSGSPNFPTTSNRQMTGLPFLTLTANRFSFFFVSMMSSARITTHVAGSRRNATVPSVAGAGCPTNHAVSPIASVC